MTHSASVACTWLSPIRLVILFSLPIFVEEQILHAAVTQAQEPTHG